MHAQHNELNFTDYLSQTTYNRPAINPRASAFSKDGSQNNNHNNRSRKQLKKNQQTFGESLASHQSNNEAKDSPAVLKRVQNNAKSKQNFTKDNLVIIKSKSIMEKNAYMQSTQPVFSNKKSSDFKHQSVD